MATDDDLDARAHALFDTIAADYLDRPDVDIAPMFGSDGLRIRGKMIAFVGSGELVVKVPRARADQIVAETQIPRVRMGDREMKEWLSVPMDARECWASLVAEAYVYLDEITP